MTNKVYELIYDYGDSYTTIFMVDSKQLATDFIESVKSHDQNFMKDYGFDDDADDVLTEEYEDSHPLKPYAKQIFNLMYEDSFSEYVTKYVGHTFASELSVIEHELLSEVSNVKTN